MTQRPTNIYTLEGLAWLQAELARKEAKWEEYNGNNPNKGAAGRRALRAQVRSVTDWLKSQGQLPLSEEELLKRNLDRQTPGRIKGCCTFLESQWYRIRFTGKDERGLWEWVWDAVSAEEVHSRGGGYIHPGPRGR